MKAPKEEVQVKKVKEKPYLKVGDKVTVKQEKVSESVHEGDYVGIITELTDFTIPLGGPHAFVDCGPQGAIKVGRSYCIKMKDVR